jgi:serine/threonine-protein kinase HipA
MKSAIQKKAGSAERQRVEVILDADIMDAVRRIGILFHTQAHGHGVFSFTYDREWLEHPDAFEIDPDLKLHSAESYPSDESGHFRIFLDSAPDRWGRLLLERRETLRAREEQRKPRTLTEWDFLLGVHDSCRMGALRFRREKDSVYLDDNKELAAPPLASLRELEAISLALEAPDAAKQPQFRKWLTALVAPGSSLGGARPKANFADPKGLLWIAKFPSREDRRDVGAWEMVVHQLALKVGVRVPEAQLLKLGSSYRTFSCQRFDRTTAGKRRFFVSALTLLDRRDGEKASYLELAEFLRSRGSQRHLKEDLRELWVRVVFSILVANRDDHLRNHGFILDTDGWRLAPAYDMNPNIDKERHQLAIDFSDSTPDVELALSTAEYYGVKTREASSLLETIKKEIRSWKTVARQYKISSEEIDLMVQAFE